MIASPDSLQLENPFPGLRSFTSEESHLFFGREGQSDGLLRKMGRGRFVAVVGVSGSGKSSLVRAGLLTSLHNGYLASAGPDWRIADFRPGGDPIGNLAAALNATGLWQGELDVNALRTSSMSLVSEAERICGSARWEEGVNLLILADQFEELFRFRVRESSMADRDEKALFVKLLLEAAKQQKLPIYVVITMRSDFLGDCAQFRNLPEAINEGQYLIPQMTREERRSAIESPILIAGGTIAPALTQRILNDTGEDPSQLPVMQHALMRTWDHWREYGDLNQPLNIQSYEAIGTLSKALSSHADEAYTEACEKIPGRADEIVKRLFQALRDQDVNGRETRRPTPLGDLCAVAEASRDEMLVVLECFRRTGRSFLMPPPGVELTDGSQVDITHECLLRQWERLVGWVTDELESRRIYQRLAYRADEQIDSDAPDFMKGAVLQLTLDWWERRRPSQAWARRYRGKFEVAEKFLRASAKNRDLEQEALEGSRKREEERRIEEVRREQQALQKIGMAQAQAETERQRAESVEKLALAEQKAHRRQRYFLFGLSILAVLLAAVGFKAYKESRTALSREIAASALSQMGTDPELSLLLAIEARNISATPEADQVLRRALAQSHIRVLLDGKDGEISGAAFISDGSRAITTSANAVCIWDVSTGKLLQKLDKLSSLAGAAMSPDGSHVVVSTIEGISRVYETSTGKEIAKLQNQMGFVSSPAFSSDGSRIVTIGQDGTAQVSGTTTGKLLATLKDIRGVSFSLDGSQILTSSGKAAMIWEMATGMTANSKPIHTLGHEEEVASAVFSPDGLLVVTVSGDKTASVWSVKTAKKISQFTDDNGAINSAAFSADGSHVVTAGDEQTARVWEASTGKLSVELRGHQGRVNSAVFSPDGSRVITASNDQTARVWETATGNLISELRGHTKRVTGATFSPDGRSVITASADQTARIWQVDVLRKVSSVYPQDSAIAVSPDGSRRVVIADAGKTAEIWDTANDKLISKLGEQADWIDTLGKFSAGNSHLITANSDGTARIWDVGTGKRLSTLMDQTSLGSSAISYDGSRVVTSSVDSENNENLSLWETATGRRIYQWRAHPDLNVSASAFSRDGLWLVTGTYSGDGVKIWEVATHKLIGELRVPMGTVTALAFSLNGSHAATVSDDQTVRIWNVATGKQISELRGHTGLVNRVEFDALGSLVLTTSVDGTARIWDATGFPIARLVWSNVDSLRTAVFSKDGKSVILIGETGAQEVYGCDVCGLETQSLANNRVTRALTPEEQAQYLHKASAK